VLGGKLKYSRGRTPNRAIFWSIATVATCAAWNPAAAQEWKLSSYLSTRFLYSDNLLLSRTRDVEAFGVAPAPGLILERTSPTSHVTFSGRFEFPRYIDHSEFNSEDQFLTLDIEKLLSERSTLRLDSSFTHDTTLRGGGADEDITDRELNKSFDYIKWQVEPSWAYLVSPIDEIVVRGTYREANYDTTQKTDYQYFGPSFDYNHQLSEIDKITSNLSWYRFIPDDPDKDRVDTLGALVGYAYDPSERFSINGAVGLSYSMRDERGEDTGDSNGGNSDVGYRVKFGMNYLIDDQNTVRASVSHDTEPSGDGEQETRLRMTVGLEHRLTQLTALGLNVDYVDDTDVFGTGGGTTSDEDDDEARYFAIRPNVSWRLTEDFSLVAEYRYRYKEFTQDNESVDSNSVFLTLRYDLPVLIGEGP
jgi:Putative MetA-pathway of phenol degradation